MSNKEIPSSYSEEFETQIRQVVEKVKLAVSGLSDLLLGTIALAQLPEMQEYASEKLKQSISGTDFGQLKEKVAKLSIACEALDYLQTSEALSILSSISGRKDLLSAYANVTVGMDKIQKFLEGKSSL